MLPDAMRSSERRENMDFMNSLMHRAAKESDKTQTALKWIHLLVDILAWKRYVKKALQWLPLRVLIWTSKVGQYIRKPLQWLQQDARKDDDTIEWLQKSNPPDLSLTLTPQKNTALHIAARFNRKGLATEVIKLCPSFIYQTNSEGDTPLHIAAEAGHLQLTEILVKAAGPQYRDLEAGTPCEVWKVRNLKGNNALQEALKKGHGKVALYLLNSYHEELACLGNEAGESPLYLAAEAGLICVVKELINKGKDYSVEGPDGQTPLHIAVIKGHLETVKTLLEKCECIDTKQKDRLGQTALHYAAALGYHKIMVSLLSKNPSLVYVFDKDGNSPLHIIAKRASRFHDHIKMAEDILHDYPCAAEQIDRKGRNALHLAVMNGNLDMLKCLLKQPELKVLINKPDGNGNTPLHLAVKNFDSGIVMTLLQMGADSGVTNNDGLTALDVNELTRKRNGMRQLFIHKILKKYGATKGRLAWVERMKHGVYDIADLKSVANTLSVVAGLLATITFAALFTVPGGNKDDGPEEGLPIFITRFALKAFLLSDILAFCCSLFIAILLIWAMVSEREVLAVIVQLSFSLSWVAGSATMVALGTAMYVVLSDKLLWMAILFLFIGCSGPFVFDLATSYSAMTTPWRSSRL